MSAGLSPVRLTAEFDGSAVKMGARQAGETIRTEMAKAEPSLTKVEQGFERVGRSGTNAANVAARGMRALSAGIGAATAAAAGTERSFISLGTSILSAFAAGGPIAGGISIVAGGIGLLAGASKEAEEAAKKAREAYSAWFAGVKAEAADVALQLAAISRETAAKQFAVVDIHVDKEQSKELDRQRQLFLKIQRIREVIDAKEAINAPDLLRASGLDFDKASAEVARRFKGQVLPNSDPSKDPWSVDGLVRFDREANRPVVDVTKETQVLKVLEKQLKDLVSIYEEIKAGKQAITDAADLKRIEDEAEARHKLNEELRLKIEVMREGSEVAQDLKRLEQEAVAKLAQGGEFGAVDEAYRRSKQDRLARYANDLLAPDTEGNASDSARAAAARDFLQLQGKITSAEDEHAKAIREQIAALRDQVQLALAVNDEEKDRVATNAALRAALANEQNDLLDIAAIYDELLGLENARKKGRENKAAEVAKEKADKEAERAAEKARSEAEAFARTRAEASRDISREIALLKAGTDERRQMLELEFRIADLRKTGVPEASLGELRSLEIERIRAQAPSLAKDLLDALGRPLSAGLTDLIADGITTGFKRGADIGKSVVDSLLHSVLESIINSTIAPAFASLFKGGGGGSGGIFADIASLVGSAFGGGGGGGAASFGGITDVAAGIGSAPAIEDLFGGGCAGGT